MTLRSVSAVVSAVVHVMECMSSASNTALELRSNTQGKQRENMLVWSDRVLATRSVCVRVRGAVRKKHKLVY